MILEDTKIYPVFIFRRMKSKLKYVLKRNIMLVKARTRFYAAQTNFKEAIKEST